MMGGPSCGKAAGGSAGVALAERRKEARELGQGTDGFLYRVAHVSHVLWGASGTVKVGANT